MQPLHTKKSSNLLKLVLFNLFKEKSCTTYLPTYLPIYVTVFTVVMVVTVVTVVTVVSTEKNPATSPQKKERNL